MFSPPTFPNPFYTTSAPILSAEQLNFNEPRFIVLQLLQRPAVAFSVFAQLKSVFGEVASQRDSNRFLFNTPSTTSTSPSSSSMSTSTSSSSSSSSSQSYSLSLSPPSTTSTSASSSSMSSSTSSSSSSSSSQGYSLSLSPTSSSSARAAPSSMVESDHDDDDNDDGDAVPSSSQKKRKVSTPVFYIKPRRTYNKRSKTYVQHFQSHYPLRI